MITPTGVTRGRTGGIAPGVKVSRKAPERRYGARKFQPGAFRLQNYWIIQLARTFLGPASYSNHKLMSHSNFTFLRS